MLLVLEDEWLDMKNKSVGENIFCLGEISPTGSRQCKTFKAIVKVLLTLRKLRTNGL
jgi:hypothetical protein